VAKPKREHGYTNIANEIWEEVFVKGVFTKNQFQVIALIINESWRWQDPRKPKKGRLIPKYKITHKPLSNTFISEQTGILLNKVNNIINELYTMGAINCHFGYYKFNKDYESYQKGKFSYQISKGKKVTKKVSFSYQKGKSKLPKREVLVTKKVSLTPEKASGHAGSETLKEKKEILKKDKENNNGAKADRKEVANYLKQLLADRGVKLPRNWHLKNYSCAESLLKTYAKAELKAAIDWGMKDHFWSKQIDSMMTIERLMVKYQLSKGEKNAQRKDSATDGIDFSRFNAPGFK